MDPYRGVILEGTLAESCVNPRKDTKTARSKVGSYQFCVAERGGNSEISHWDAIRRAEAGVSL